MRNAVPRCHVCKKPVEGFVRAKTALTLYVEFTALCHGQRETVQVPIEFFELHTDATIEYGEAFRPAGLLTEASPRGE